MQAYPGLNLNIFCMGVAPPPPFNLPVLLEKDHLEERLLDQVQVRAPHTRPILGSSVQHTPMHDIGWLTPGKIINFGDKFIP